MQWELLRISTEILLFQTHFKAHVIFEMGLLWAFAGKVTLSVYHRIPWKPAVRIEVKVQVLVAQSCLTLCNPMDCSPPGSSVHGIFQARILGRVAIPFSRGSSQPRDRTWVSCISRQILYHLSCERSHELGYFLILAIVNNASWILGCMYFFELVFSFSSDICPGMELLDPLVFLFLVFFLRKCHIVFYSDSSKLFFSASFPVWSKSERERQIPYDTTYMFIAALFTIAKTMNTT